MKRTRILLSVLFLTFASSLCYGAGPAKSAPTSKVAKKEIVYKVDDMKCDCCAKKITERVGRIPNVKIEKIDTKAKEVRLSYNPNDQPDQKLIERAIRRSGFKKVKQVSLQSKK